MLRDWDHPRACGEHACSTQSLPIRVGSSPRLRGTQTWKIHHADRGGIIPALAGNTHGPCSATNSTRDHPRACGEHHPPAQDPRRRQGSSPRLRGTLSRPIRSLMRFWDHPRACGEHLDERRMLAFGEGSSPRLRGTHLAKMVANFLAGIIPALAGNTSISSLVAVGVWDHPRACGEHVRFDGDSLIFEGSSPRLRGTRSICRVGELEFGIIPALAGNTRCEPVRGPAPWDHPRACGEHHCVMQ